MNNKMTALKNARRKSAKNIVINNHRFFLFVSFLFGTILSIPRNLRHFIVIVCTV
jgi:hypothetical protein